MTYAGNITARHATLLVSSECGRAASLTAAGANVHKIAKEVYQLPLPEPSQFESEAGKRFERNLFAQNARSVVVLYQEKFGWWDNSYQVTVKNLQYEQETDQEDTSVSHEQRMSEAAGTRELLLARLNNEPGAPDIVLQGRLYQQFGGTYLSVVPDIMVFDQADHCWRFGEVKVYLDKDGLTNPSQIASAALQVAVGVVAARKTLGNDNAVPATADLIFQSLRFVRKELNRATLNRISIQAEIEAVQGLVGELPSIDQDTAAKLRAGDRNTVESIPHRYTPSCHGLCPLAHRCREEATARGEGLWGTPGMDVMVGLGYTVETITQAVAGSGAGEGRGDALRWVRQGWRSGGQVTSGQVP